AFAGAARLHVGGDARDPLVQARLDARREVRGRRPERRISRELSRRPLAAGPLARDAASRLRRARDRDGDDVARDFLLDDADRSLGHPAEHGDDGAAYATEAARKETRALICVE